MWSLATEKFANEISKFQSTAEDIDDSKDSSIYKNAIEKVKGN